jgi:predicted HTH domain antitoxin
LLSFTHRKQLTPNDETQNMAAIQELNDLNRQYKVELYRINQLSLTEWVTLAKRLGVRLNDREEAATKIARMKRAK